MDLFFSHEKWRKSNESPQSLSSNVEDVFGGDDGGARSHGCGAATAEGVYGPGYLHTARARTPVGPEDASGSGGSMPVWTSDLADLFARGDIKPANWLRLTFLLKENTELKRHVGNPRESWASRVGSLPRDPIVTNPPPFATMHSIFVWVEGREDYEARQEFRRFRLFRLFRLFQEIVDPVSEQVVSLKEFAELSWGTKGQRSSRFGQRVLAGDREFQGWLASVDRLLEKNAELGAALSMSPSDGRRRLVETLGESVKGLSKEVARLGNNSGVGMNLYTDVLRVQWG